MQYFYHGTTLENWEAIQAEQQLWGEREAGQRCTYLASDIAEAAMYGEVLLQIAYDPTAPQWYNNWVEGAWQHREYRPIPQSCIVQIEPHLALAIKKIAEDRALQYRKLDQIQTFIAETVLGENRFTVQAFINGGDKVWIASNQAGRDGDLNQMGCFIPDPERALPEHMRGNK